MSLRSEVEAHVYGVLMDGCSVADSYGCAESWVKHGYVSSESVPSVARYIRQASRPGDVPSYVHVPVHSGYLVFLPSRDEAIAVPEARHTDVVTAYHGTGKHAAKIVDIAQMLGLSKQEAREYLRAFDITHDTLPVTTEEIDAGEGVARIKERTVHSKRAELARAFEREKTKAAAAYWDFEAHVLPRINRVADREVQGARPKDCVTDWLAIVSFSDVHLGKITIDRKGLAHAREKLANVRERALAACLDRPVRTVWLPLGNDWFHIDTPRGTTTSGTPQDSVFYDDIVVAGLEEARITIETFAQHYEEVHVPIVRSNHDHASTVWLSVALRAMYAEDDRVNVYSCPLDRGYFRWRAHLFAFDHGEKGIGKRSASTFAMEAGNEWSAVRHRWKLCGHLHHTWEKDEGVKFLFAPSISGTDRWHSKNEYTLASPASPVYFFDPEGHVFERTILFTPETDIREIRDLS